MRRMSWVVFALATALAVVSTATACEDDLTSSDAAPADSPGLAEPTETPPPTLTSEEPTVPTDDAQPQPRQPVPVPPPETERRVIGEVPAAQLEAVISDAAERAGVAPERVEVLRAQAVQWNDGSLGCPQPGETYIQMIVDGYWVELSAGGREFDYRLDGHGNFHLCEQPNRVSPYGTDR